ncbi:MAG: hypothetical protein AAB116_23975 [Candidatus Poribacteria bacterium]
MPWEYILGSAGTAGILLVFGILLGQRILERMVDHRFNMNLEQVRGDINRKLEFDRSDLAVWMDLRKNILIEMWQVHRELVKSMTAVILDVQRLATKNTMTELKPTIETYRQMVHNQIYLLSPEAIDICQRFLGTAHDLADGKIEVNDGNALKRIRHEFYSLTAKLYGLEKMMPWMAQEQAPNQVQNV